MTYAAFKAIHLLAVTLTWVLFTLRGIWMLTESPRLQSKWARVLPHVNDTALLAAGLTMALVAGHRLTDGWLAAKLAGLALYIVLGSFALKRGRTRAVRIAAFGAAQAVFLYIVAVAFTKRVIPFA